jgi:putative transposase
MPKKGYTPEQIINKLREAEVLLNEGASLAIMIKRIGSQDFIY